MGRLYIKTLSGENTLAYFDGGQVRSARHSTDTLVKYSGGTIYQDELDYGPHTIAQCDEGGNIYAGNGAYGSILAKCKDGVIYEGGSDWNSTLAWYEGDMYGAAAAAAVTLLGLGETKQASHSEASAGASGDSSTAVTGGHAEVSFFSMVLSLLMGLLLLLPRILYYFPILIVQLLNGNAPILFTPQHFPFVLCSALGYLCPLLVWRKLRKKSGGKMWVTYFSPVLYIACGFLFRLNRIQLSDITLLFLIAGIVWDLRRLQTVSKKDLFQAGFAVYLPTALDLLNSLYGALVLHNPQVHLLPSILMSAVWFAVFTMLLRVRDAKKYSAKVFWLWIVASLSLIFAFGLISKIFIYGY